MIKPIEEVAHTEQVEKGDCCVCGEKTTQYCLSCADAWGKTWYCAKHYQTTVLTGNCCRGNEMAYE